MRSDVPVSQNNELHTPLTLFKASQALAEDTIQSQMLVKHCLNNIQHYDSVLGAMLAVDAEGAMAAAAAADNRRQKNQAISSIDGIPIVIKDNIVTSHIETTAASKILKGWLPPYDATVVTKLHQAGAIIIGKSNMDEFGMGSSTEHSAYKPCKNPYDVLRVPGGSSGGSAVAVSTSMGLAALGSDTGGSVRQPAAMTGTVGLKPTYGRVSRYGLIAYASSLDQIGVITHDVASAHMLLRVLEGQDSRDATSKRTMPLDAALLPKEMRGVRIGYVKQWMEHPGLHDDVKQGTAHALDLAVQQGATAVAVEIPYLEYALACYYIIATAEASSNLSRYDGVRFGQRIQEGATLDAMISQTRGELLGYEVKKRIMLGNFVLSQGFYEAYYGQAQKVRTTLVNDYRRVWQQCDVLLSPVSPSPAFLMGEKNHDPLSMYLADIFTVPASLAGLPAVSIPAGWSKTANTFLPVGVQLTSPWMQDQSLLQYALLWEQQLQWKQKQFDPILSS